MTTTTSTATTTGDAAAIDELLETFALQKAAFLLDPYPSADERRQRLGALAAMLLGNRNQIREALDADFGAHPKALGDLVECLGIVTRIAHSAENVEAWMQPEERPTDPALFGTGKALVVRQPKGVIGNISPWNFPFDLSVGPLADILAAGNRAILKPSDMTPACSELLRTMIRATFDRDMVDVAVGGLALAEAFSGLRWDHLLYTGNPEVARKVALAAAANLVPTTLELGGKCPAILSGDSVDAATIAHLLGIKLVKNGQMCISVDYCLVPRDKVEAFIDLAVGYAREHLAGYSSSESCTGIINARHLARLQGLVAEAEARGVRVVQLDEGGVVDPITRRMPVSLVIDPPDDLGVMRDEIFGPILPVKPYDTLDAAIDYINAGERPLGLYVMARDESVVDQVRSRTSSGGLGVNVCAAQAAVPGLGFGGVGNSGSGRHHGIDGFREFSNPRGVFIRGEGDVIDVYAPPYGDVANAVVEFGFALAQGG